MYYSTRVTSPVGELTLACDGGGQSLVGLWIEGQKYFGGTVPGPARESGDMPVFAAVKAWLERYFAGEKPAVSELSLAPAGGDFRRGVWDILREIPYGEVITYGAVARKMAERMHRAGMSGQAVGGAVGHNPISIIIPCHRVVGSDGSLTGYAAGVATKLKLLELEGADTSRLFIPKMGIGLRLGDRNDGENQARRPQ